MLKIWERIISSYWPKTYPEPPEKVLRNRKPVDYLTAWPLEILFNSVQILDQCIEPITDGTNL